MEISSAIILLLVVMDPLGNIPIFLSVLDNVDKPRRFRVMIRELFIALLKLMLFIFAGSYLLKFFGLSQEAVGIASAIVLFVIVIRMIFTAKRDWLENLPDGELFIVPLAIPFAGRSYSAPPCFLSYCVSAA